MRAMSIGTYYKIKNVMSSMNKDLLSDLASEVLSELFNPKYVTDDERVTGILEAIEFVTEVNTK